MLPSEIRAVAIGQLRQLPLGVVGISNISTTSILFPYQSVKLAIAVSRISRTEWLTFLKSEAQAWPSSLPFSI